MRTSAAKDFAEGLLFHSLVFRMDCLIIDNDIDVVDVIMEENPAHITDLSIPRAITCIV
ncbi:Uncharacterized protein APZ42_009935, partial [Daphnia magna]